MEENQPRQTKDLIGHIRTLPGDEQLKVILDCVVQKDFAAAHRAIEAIGKKGDTAFYAWLEDSLHDVLLREDWRRYIEGQK